MVFLGGISTWMVFQGVATLATGVLLFEEIREVGVGGIEQIVAQHPNVVFGANALGQVVGLLMLTIVITRLHTPDVFAFLRVRRADTPLLLMAGAGTFAVIPLASWIGHYARQLPYPDVLVRFDEEQRVLVEQVLGGEINIVLALLFVALTPAICEEVIFRGYLQRNVERRLGAAASIVIVALLFGLFHLRVTEFIPLALIGAYLGYVVWVSGSLWAGVLVHLLNNGTAVLVSQYNQTRPDPVVLDEMVMPWYLALVGLMIVLGLSAAMLRRRNAILAPVASSPSHFR